MSQNKSHTPFMSRYKLSALGWVIAGVIVVSFWEALLGVGLIVLAGYWLCKYQDKLLKWGRQLLQKLLPPTDQKGSK